MLKLWNEKPLIIGNKLADNWFWCEQCNSFVLFIHTHQPLPHRVNPDTPSGKGA